MTIEDLSPLTEIAPQQSMVLDIFSRVWTSASTEPLQVPKVRDCINQNIPMLINSFNRTDAVTFVAFVGDILPNLPFEVSLICPCDASYSCNIGFAKGF